MVLDLFFSMSGPKVTGCKKVSTSWRCNNQLPDHMSVSGADIFGALLKKGVEL